MKKKLKPLSCFYCDNSTIKPGYKGNSYMHREPPFAECYCPDLPKEIFNLHDHKVDKLYVSSASWLPYHCGHFIGRLILTNCARKACKLPFIIHEWRAARDMYIGPYDKLCCSGHCAKIMAALYKRGING